MIRVMFLCAFMAGAAAIVGMSYIFLGTDLLALSVTLVIGLVYGIGAIELIQFHKATQSLHLALVNVPNFAENEIDAHQRLSLWMETLHSSLKHAVYSRIEGESKGLPSPVLTPYLVGLLVMLGLLGTFVGMVDTLQGSVIALQGSTELSAIREGLAAPIKGLGAAFGTSVAGVAASAMLGLMSTLSRRERILVARELDAKINTVFRSFSLNFNRQETYKSLQQQARALPELAAQITVMAQNLEQMGQRLGQELNHKQDKFHESVEHVYQNLAESVGKSLNQAVQNSGEHVAKQVSPIVNELMSEVSTKIQQNVLDTQAELVHQNKAYLDGVSDNLKEYTLTANQSWQTGLKEHEKIQINLSSTMQDSLNQFSDQFQALASRFVNEFIQHADESEKQRQLSADTKLAQWSETLDRSNEKAYNVLGTFSNDQQKAWESASNVFLTSTQALSQELSEAVKSQETSQQKASELMSSLLTELHDQALDNSTKLNRQVEEINHASEQSLLAREQAESVWKKQHTDAMTAISSQLTEQLTALRDQEQNRADKALEHLSQLETTVASQLSDLGQSLEQPMSRLIETASQAPKAAAEVITKLKEEMTQNMARDNDLLEERRRIMSDLDRLSDSLAQSTVNQGKAMETLLSSSGNMLAEVSERFDTRVDTEVNKLSDIAAQFAESSIDIASMSDAFVSAIERFSESNDSLVEHLNKIEVALEDSTSRSDEQLAYYVAQAREIIDHSMMSQKGLIEEIQSDGYKTRRRSGRIAMELEEAREDSPPIWAIFGDLMSGLVGVFVLLLIWVIGYQLELSKSLEEEVAKRQAEEQRRLALEEALADPLSSGRVTFQNGKIGISGSVLFSLNSDQLQSEGRQLLTTLVVPLKMFLGERNEMLMVSGFTDDLPIQKGNLRYQDNWELSAQRALTVTRTLIEEGMPPEMVFAAAFGAQSPVVPNVDSESRSKNRRVEMAPVPKAKAEEMR